MINGMYQPHVYFKQPQPDFSSRIHAEHVITDAYTLQKPQQNLTCVANNFENASLFANT